MIFATRAVHCSANDVTEGFSHFITGRIRTIPCAGSEAIRLYRFRFVGMNDRALSRKIMFERALCALMKDIKKEICCPIWAAVILFLVFYAIEIPMVLFTKM